MEIDIHTEKIYRKQGVKNLRVYFHGNNLATFSKWDMWILKQEQAPGDNYPLSRKFNFASEQLFKQHKTMKRNLFLFC